MFVVERQGLAIALSTVSALAGTAADTAMLVAQDDGTLVVAAGDADRGARCSTLASRTLLAGSVAVPLKPLLRLLGHSHGSKVEVVHNGKQTAVAIDGDGVAPRRVTFPAQEDAGDIPDRPPADPDAVTVELSSAAFATACHRTAFCVTRKSSATRWATDGVQFDVADGRLTASATDCFRLASAHAPASVPGKATAKFLVAEGTLRAWLRILKTTESVRLSFGERLTVRAGSFAAWASPHEGVFPEASAIPSEFPHAVAVPREPLEGAIESALALSDGPGDQPVTFSLRRGALVVSAGVAGARVESTVAVPNWTGPALTIDLDGRRTLGVLRAYADSPTISLRYASADEPVAIEVADARAILVPHRERSEAPAKRAKQAV
jgi:DNA polymerase III sliding clamp (beta) subunit (PCNA family)